MPAVTEPAAANPTKPLPPLLSGEPILGHVRPFMRDRAALFRRGLAECGPVFALKLGNRMAAVLIGPEYHEIFFRETDQKLSMNKAYTFLKAALGEVAFVASPETYTLQRPVLIAPFKAEKMPAYVEVMVEEVETWLDGLGEAGEFELVGAMNELVQNIAAHALMGREFRDRMGREFWSLYGLIGQSLDPLLPPHWPLPKFIRRDRAKAKLQAMLLPIIVERRAHPQAYDDFLQQLVSTRLASGEPAPDETIVSLIMGLMFAGHETTVGQATWTIIQLLQNPEYLAAVREELDAAGHAGGSVLDAKHLRRLERTHRAVLETARMHPSADLLLRVANAELEVGDYRIPEGWMVLVSAEVAHYLPSVFSRPEVYDPERFGPGRAEDRTHRFALIGFGGGLHKCAGMNFALNEMAVIAALLFRRYELTLLTPEPKAVRGQGASRPAATRVAYRARTSQG